MSVVKKNIIANLAGNVWTGLMSLVFVPIYIHFLGIEAYGLMGIFSAMLAFFALFDMGLSSTLNREIARLSVQEHKARDMRDLVRTLEIPYLIVGLLIAVGIVSASPLIANHWVKAKALSPHTVKFAVVAMGLSVAFQWPIALYSGGLMGLHRQVLLNGINSVIATFRGLGAVLVLWLISPTVVAFFIWQVGIGAIQVGLIAFSLWRSLPFAPNRPRFRLDLLKNIWKFAAGMTTLAITATILRQTDKVVLSRMLTLDQFGYYSLASVASMTLYRLLSPIFESIYPQFTRLVELGDKKSLADLYHKSAQLVSVLILTTALLVAGFSQEILLLWTRNTVTASSTHILVSILILGTALNCVINVPYALQIAHGWTRLAFLVDSISIFLLVPLMVLFTRRFGPIGAASVWVILNLGYVFISVPIMHKRLLITEKWEWYTKDLLRPFIVSFTLVVIGRIIIKPFWPPMQLLGSISALGLFTLIASAMVANRLSVSDRMRLLIQSIRTGLLAG